MRWSWWRGGRTGSIWKASRPTRGRWRTPCCAGCATRRARAWRARGTTTAARATTRSQTFTPAESGTYYISARGLGDGVGTYTLTVTDTTPVTDTTTSTDATPVTDATRAGATDLGDITALQGPRFPQGTLDGDADEVDYYRFTLTEAKKVGLGLRQQDANADLFLEDADGTVLYSSTNSGTDNEAIAETLLAGTYYLRVESQEAGGNAHVVRYGVSAPDADAVAALQQQSGTAVNAAPAFAETSYTFYLAENADGSTDRVSLGTVAATDPEGATLSYTLVGGNDSFEVDETTGELFYTGTGEDFESETTYFFMMVRASDGSLHPYTSVTVNVTDVDETPTFVDASYTFALAENADGSTDRVSLGTVAATDPEGTTLAYSLVGGNESGSFDVDATSGELFYKGSGEDFESGTTQFTLTVRASDGSETAETTVTVDVTDVDETPAIRVTDAEATEGDDTEMVFRVTLQSASSGTVTVNYATADGTATAGEDYTATSGTLTFAPGETEKTVSVAIIDDTVEDSGETFTLVLSDPSGGRLADAEATGTIFNTEVPTSVSEADGADLPADTTTTGVIAVNGSATGTIARPIPYYASEMGVGDGDHDWFRVTLEANHVYQIYLRGSGTLSSLLVDSVLAGVFKSDGTYIEGTWNDDGGLVLSSALTFTPDADGTYYVAASGYRGHSGTYEVSVTDVTAVVDDYSNDTSTTGLLTVDGGSVTGTIGPWHDRDWFKVALVKGNTYQFDLKGAPSGSGTLKDPDLYGMFNSSGKFLYSTRNFEGGGPRDDDRLIFTAGSTGNYYVSADGFSLHTGTYTLSVTDVSADYPNEIASEVGTTGTVAVGGSVTGEFEFFHDHDWFAVTLQAEKTYRFDLEGADTNAGTVTDTTLWGIFDADGNFIDDTSRRHGGFANNSRVDFAPETDGTYYVSAGGSLTGPHSYNGTYTLSVTEVSDEM